MSRVGRGLAQLTDAFTEVALKLTATAWNTPSPCPGWTAGDVVAHVLSLESEMHGDPLPDHEPDWAALPHVTNDFSRYTEVPVDWYRSKGRDVVLAELREMSNGANKILPTLGRSHRTDGWPWRNADAPGANDPNSHPGHLDARAGHPHGSRDPGRAWQRRGLGSCRQFLSGLPYVWGKAVGAPIGSSLQLAITGPGVEFERTVVVADDGRARFLMA